MKAIIGLVNMSLLIILLALNFNMPKGYSNLGNNEIKAGKIVEIEYSKNPESLMYEECTDIITFEIDGELYTTKDFAEDMQKDDWCLITINNLGTQNIDDDVILDYRCYWDYRNGEYVFEP